jgi:fibronectin type 3 domain-containing protein
VRALLLKPAAFAGLIGLAIIGSGLLIFATLALIARSPTSSASSVCDSPPTGATVLASARTANVSPSTTSGSLAASLQSAAASAMALDTVPSAPLSVVAAAGNAQVAVSWSAPAPNGGSPMTGYDVYQGTTTGGELATPIATVGATATSYIDPGLTNGTTYYYTVVAVNAAGASAPSTEVSATPTAPTVPSTPTGLAASGGNGQIVLSWAAPGDGGSMITGYSVYRGTVQGKESTTAVATATTTSFTDTGLTNGTTYYYTLAAVNVVGTSPTSAEVSATPSLPATAPSAPQGLTASSGNGVTNLSWSAPASDGGSPITGYDVYRGTASGGESATPIATDISGTSFTDTGLTNGTTYYYTVAAVNTAGVSGQSAEASATPVEPQLCEEVQAYPSVAEVAAGDTASFVVLVWSTGAASSNVSVGASVVAATYLDTPSWAICPSASGTTCTIASLPLNQVYELLVSVPVSSSAPDGANVQFTAQALASGALSFSGSGTEVVTSGGISATTTTPSSAVPPLISLPAIPGTGVSAVNPSELFPTVSPSSGGTLGLPGARSPSPLRAADVSSTVPIDARLIGAQIVGLAVLAGAVTIAILRLSVRRRLSTPAPPASTDKN